MSYLQSYCTIVPGLVNLNGEKYFKTRKSPFVMNDFFSAIYDHLNIDYRKFYKMDALSKLGFLASEILLTGSDREKSKDSMSIILFNRSSSLEADINYQKTIQKKEEFYPSPADFVYTLPNIVTGEIAIRNKIHGETAFYVLRDYYDQEMFYIINNTIKYGGMKSVLAGWVEVDAFNNMIDCTMMLITSKSGNSSNSHLPVGLKHVNTDINVLYNEFTLYKLTKR